MKKFSQWAIYILSLICFSVVAQQEAEQEEETTAQAQAQEVQEIKYVTDKLRLSLYKSPSENSGTLKLLTSGDALKLLEKSGNYSRVEADDGQVGWVKTGFLVSDATASFQLIEEKKKNEILVNQLEQYSDTQQLVADYENTISLMKSDEEKMSAELQTLQQELQQAADKNTQLEQMMQDAKQGKIGIMDVIEIAKQYWYLLVGMIVIFVMAGFVAGKQMIEAQVRRRFQGMKVW